jgi:hypothetical protein
MVAAYRAWLIFWLTGGESISNESEFSEFSGGIRTKLQPEVVTTILFIFYELETHQSPLR